MKLNDMMKFEKEGNETPSEAGYHLRRRGDYEVEVRLDGKPVRLFINTSSYNASWIDACNYTNERKGR
tara:strand:- start:335 stop:538 length:204 start_codon:yes stop_codon:yes gene_type:complete